MYANASDDSNNTLTALEIMTRLLGTIQRLKERVRAIKAQMKGSVSTVSRSQFEAMTRAEMSGISMVVAKAFPSRPSLTGRAGSLWSTGDPTLLTDN